MSDTRGPLDLEEIARREQALSAADAGRARELARIARREQQLVDAEAGRGLTRGQDPSANRERRWLAEARDAILDDQDAAADERDRLCEMREAVADAAERVRRRMQLDVLPADHPLVEAADDEAAYWRHRRAQAAAERAAHAAARTAEAIRRHHVALARATARPAPAQPASRPDDVVVVVCVFKRGTIPQAQWRLDTAVDEVASRAGRRLAAGFAQLGAADDIEAVLVRAMRSLDGEGQTG